MSCNAYEGSNTPGNWVAHYCDRPDGHAGMHQSSSGYAWSQSLGDYDKHRAMEAGVGTPCRTCHRWACICERKAVLQ